MMRAWLVLFLVMLPAAAAAQDQFAPGAYDALPRDSTTLNRFRGVEFEFLTDGTMLWRRGSAVQQVMTWRAPGQVFELEEAVGCHVAPRGIYRVTRWLDGFVFEVLQDGCTNRVAALNAIYLVPRSRLVAR